MPADKMEWGGVGGGGEQVLPMAAVWGAIECLY